MTVKYFLLLSSLGLVLTAQAQDCSVPPVYPNMSLRDSDMLLESFQEGVKVGYVCSVGYMSAGGSPTSVCSAGSWSALALKCEKKNCGSAGEVLNGDVQYPDGTEFGATVKVVCNTGFRLVGGAPVNCIDKGWSGRLPDCEVVACEVIPQVDGGTHSPDKESFEYRDVISFTCQKGLTLIGSRDLSCSENGTFTPAPPACRKIECEKPDIANAQRLGGYKPTYKYRETVKHECNPGYKRIGESTSVCEKDGDWIPKLMSCEPKNCSKPVGGSGMSLEEKDSVSQIFLHDTSATFVCNHGYDPAEGSAVIKCTAGEWSPLTLRCRPKNCPKPVGGDNMSLKDKDSVSQVFPHGSSATFVCNEGYHFENGSDVIRCTTGNWSSLTLRCKINPTTPGKEGGGTGEGGGDKDGQNGSTTGRDVGIAAGVLVIVAAIFGGIFYMKKKNQGFHKGTRENATAGDEGEPVQLT